MEVHLTIGCINLRPGGGTATSTINTESFKQIHSYCTYDNSVKVNH